MSAVKHYTNVYFSRNRLFVRGFDENWNMPLETIANSTKVALEKVRQIAKEHNLLVEKSI